MRSINSAPFRKLCACWSFGGALLLAFAFATNALAQSATEIIRGKVFGPDSVPVAQAEVIVTGLVSRMTQSARTDRNGSYTLVFPQAEGEYLVAVRKIGFKTASFRLSRVGLSAVLGSNVYLSAASTVLDRVVITAGPTIGERSAIGEVGAGALADSLLLADPARLMELLLSIPGVALDDSTFSVMGSAANQNITTVDGVSVRGGGGGLPPDAIASVRVVTSSADPARGGFSGGNVSQTLRGGTDIFGGTVRFSTSNRGLVWQDPSWNRPVSRPINHSGTVNGPIVKQKLRYNLSWNVDDNTSDWYSLLSPRSALLEQRGISMDSVAAVTAALNGLGVPLSLSAAPANAHNQVLRTTEVLDFAPNATTSIRLSHNGRWQKQVGNNGSETSFPTRVNELSVASHSFGLRTTSYIKGLLNELTAGFEYYSDDQDPYTLLPGGSVRVGTDFRDGRTGLGTLSFGGGEGDYYENTSNAEIQNEISWLPNSGRHKVKIGGRLSFNRSDYFYFPGSPLLGTYTYLTIEDLVANRPASYDRVITNTARNTKARTSSMWIGDEWKASDAWQWQGGIRMDFAHPGTFPRYNPAAEATFGIRTDLVPNDVGMSPRIGFSWASAARRGQGTAGGSATMGGMSAQAISGMGMEMVSSIIQMQRSSTLPGIGVTGTFGAYRGTVGTNTIAELVESTGLPGTRITLSCVGAAVPVPDWTNMTEGPNACADGTTGTTFSIAKPLIRVFDPSFRAPLSWRSNLGIDGIRVPGKWILAVQGNLSWNVNNQSTVDLNLNRTPQFFIPGEANRPVYAPASAVVPSTGSISSGASRISPDFATVSNVLSDLRSYRAELQASLAPPNPLFNRRVTLNFTYSLGTGRNEARGNSRVGTTGDPFAKQWVLNPNPSHTFRMTSTGRLWGGFNFGINTFLYSGLPLTPMVNGDINGDGQSGNDRAFIPDPATVSDADLASQLNELISSAPSGARRCLVSQLGRMAAANSCRTPWQARIDISASITPPSGWSYSDRLRLTFNMSNANGALVRAFGLENTPFGQSPLSTNPNSTLLYVTGFDPATNQFKYRVNQLFGQPSNFGSARRKFAPTQLYLGLEYVFGGPVLNPISRGLGLREPANQKPLTDEQRREAIARLKKDPVAQYTAMDSLALSQDQRSQFDALSREYHARADTALTPLRNWVLRQGRRVFDRDLGQRLSATQASLARLNTEYAKKAEGVLTAEQLTRFKESSAKKED